MTDKPENPQAFPHGNPTHGGDIGMTLRDYFAGQALAGLSGLARIEGMSPEDLASMAYADADAMLKERSK